VPSVRHSSRPVAGDVAANRVYPSHSAKDCGKDARSKPGVWLMSRSTWAGPNWGTDAIEKAAAERMIPTVARRMVVPSFRSPYG
jgi:hypothetical protein